MQYNKGKIKHANSLKMTKTTLIRTGAADPYLAAERFMLTRWLRLNSLVYDDATVAIEALKSDEGSVHLNTTGEGFVSMTPVVRHYKQRFNLF